LVTVVWFMFFVQPKRSDISDIDDQIATTQSEAQALRGQVAALIDIRDSELTFRRASGELKRSIPDSPELATFVDDVNLLAIEAGIELISLTPATPQVTEGAPFVQVPVALNVGGQFFEVLGFLYGLSDLERLVRVDTLAITSSNDEDGNLTLNATIGGSLFTFETNLPTPSTEPLPSEEEPADSVEEEPAPADDGTEPPADGGV
jgi:Tfp pilus assembly protein PilO